MLVSSHQPMFLGWAGYWAKIAKSDVHVVLGGVSGSKDDGVNKFQFRGNGHTLPMRGETRRKSYKAMEFVPDSLEKVTRSIRQEICCKRHAYGDRLKPLLRVMDTFRGDSFFDLVIDCNEVIASILGIKTKFEIDITEDMPTDKTTGVFIPVDRHVPKPYEYLAGRGALNYLMKHLVPPGTEIWVQTYGAALPYNGDSIVQLIAAEQHPLQKLQSVCRWELMA